MADTFDLAQEGTTMPVKIKDEVHPAAKSSIGSTIHREKSDA